MRAATMAAARISQPFHQAMLALLVMWTRGSLTDFLVFSIIYPPLSDLRPFYRLRYLRHR